MRRYPGMRLPPTSDPVMRNEMLKADRQLKQVSSQVTKKPSKIDALRDAARGITP